MDPEGEASAARFLRSWTQLPSDSRDLPKRPDRHGTARHGASSRPGQAVKRALVPREDVKGVGFFTCAVRINNFNLERMINMDQNNKGSKLLPTYIAA
ncbi:Autophagy-Related Protein 2-like A [Manis pentadactyla]|nr:Autophagy-Related Protein 2-like A [Manis pentadactyla]